MPRLPRTMITFDVPGARFSARVGGVCLRDGHVLLQSSESWEIYIRWFPIDDLPRVYPLFMPSGLRDLPAHPTRVVDWEVT